MSETEHKPCYGTMIPDLQSRGSNGSVAGRVFSLVAVTPPGMFPPRPQLRTDLKQWDSCLRCPDFDHCYKLGMARLAVQTAVGGV